MLPSFDLFGRVARLLIRHAIVVPGDAGHDKYRATRRAVNDRKWAFAGKQFRAIVANLNAPTSILPDLQSRCGLDRSDLRSPELRQQKIHAE